MGGSPEERSARFFDRIIQKVEPSGVGSTKRLPLYLDLFTREFVQDTRTFAFKVVADMSSDHPFVTGYFEFPEHKTALREFLDRLDLKDIEDRTELVPAPSLGEKPFGVVTAKNAFIYDRPTGEKREAFTECAMGDLLFLLKEESGHFLCHGPTGYVGYIHLDAVKRLTAEEFDHIYPTEGTSPEIENVIAAAHAKMGVPYVWGGISDKGIDCSGLVYSSMRTIGIQMPRDADQHSLVGRLVATRWHRTALRRGDTLYFLSRRGTISHTAIYLGENKYIEATGPAVKITSFDPNDPDYNEKRAKSFCFAKRVIE
jgi:cell wall-associated NlpC family hydrolase